MPDRILVVEDDRDLADLLGILLTKRKYDAKVTYCGTDALETASSFSPDIILQDYMLPDINGTNLLTSLKRTCPETNLIVMTAKGSEDVAVDVMKAGAADYIRKPFDNDKLLSTIENTLKLRSSQETFRNLRKELRFKNNELMALNAISNLLVSDISLSEKYQTAAGIVLKKMKAGVANIFVTNEPGGQLMLVASKGSVNDAFMESVLSMGEGLVSYAAETKMPVIVDDFKKENRFNVSAETHNLGLVSGIAVPLLVKDAVTGVLAVYYKDERPFDSSDMEVMGNFVNLIGLSSSM